MDKIRVQVQRQYSGRGLFRDNTRVHIPSWDLSSCVSNTWPDQMVNMAKHMVEHEPSLKGSDGQNGQINPAKDDTAKALHLSQP